MWVGLCGVIGHPELPQDHRFSTPDARHLNRKDLWAILEAAFLGRPASAWVEDLIAAQVPAAPIKNVIEALSDAQEHGRGMVIDIGEGEALFKGIATPIGLPGTEPQRATYPPRTGEHTEEVLTELLGLSPHEISTLSGNGVLGKAA
jgi:crotonobetainyl-CoA:carnitine CoA-transferase CaiB-like acyl-CoA transferase